LHIDADQVAGGVHLINAEERLLTEGKCHPITRRLKTAPGLGPLRIAQLVALVMTPHRFRTSRQFWTIAPWPWSRREVELGVGCEVRTAVLWDDSPSATAQGLTRRTASTLAKSESGRLRGPRVNGNVFSLDNSFLRSRRSPPSPRSGRSAQLSAGVRRTTHRYR
jgi:hypothetical protein